MFLCRPRRAGASASAWVSSLRVCAGSIFVVDHADLDGGVDAAGDPLVLGGQLLVQRVALVVRRGGQLLLVQDADRGLGAHHRDLGVRPGEHLGGAQRRGSSSRCRRRRRSCGSPA